MLRLAEDNRADAQGTAPGDLQGGVGVHVRGRRLQPSADAESERQLSWCRMIRGSSVSVLPKTGEKKPYLQVLPSLRGSFACSSKIELRNSSENGRFSAT